MNRRLIGWALSNAAFSACLYLGVVQGVAGARNVAIFYAWCGFAASLVTLNKEFAASLQEKGPPSPFWLDGLFDTGVVALLIWHGWFATGVAYALHTLLLHGAYAPSPTPEAKERTHGDD